MNARTVSRAVWGAALVMALGYLLVFLSVVLPRLVYPYELEWVEGAVLLEVKRVLAGAPLYTPPSLDYIPLIYPPLYMYAGALVALLTGPTYLALRLVSLLSTVVTVALLVAWLRWETRDWLPAVLAAGFYAAVYRLNGTWYDVGRVDAFYLMWVLLGLMVLRRTRTARGGIFAALCFLAAFWTKQTALTLVLPILLYAAGQAIARDRREMGVFVVVFLALLGASLLLGRLLTHGWLTYYLFFIPGHFQFSPTQSWEFWKSEVLARTGLAFAGTVVYLWWEGVEGRGEDVAFFAAVFLGLFGSAWAARSHAGSFLNDLMPAYLAMALGGGLLLGRARTWGAERPAASGALALLALLQMLSLAYNPKRVVPPRQNLAAGRMVVRRLAQIPGDVFVPYHPNLAERAGKPVHTHMAGIVDVVRGDPDGWGSRLRAALHAAIREKRFAAIVLEQPKVTFLDEETERLVEEVYGPPERLFTDNVTFRTITGWRIRPDRVYGPVSH